MKFTVALPDFQKLVQQVFQAVPPRSTLPVLENIHFELNENSLEAVATDQELTIISSINVEGDGNGRVLAPARKLNDIVKALGNSGSLTVDVDPSMFKLTLKTDRGEYVMFGLDPNEFPPRPDVSGGVEASFARSTIQRIAQKTTFAVSKDEYRPALTGILFKFNVDSFNAVGTDSIRLACLTLEGTEEYPLPGKEFEAIIPARTVELMKRAESDTTLRLTATHACFEMNNTTVITRIIDEKFPPYEAIIPSDNDKLIKFLPSEALGSIKRVSLFSSAISRQVQFKISGDTWTIIGSDHESGNQATETIPCEYDGDDLDISFNFRFLQEVLDHVANGSDERAVLAVSTPSKAVLIKPLVKDGGDGEEEVESKELLMLVMPSRPVNT